MHFLKSFSSIAAVSALCLVAPLTFGSDTLDPNLPEYKKTAGIAGNLNSVGSDTLNNMMAMWAENFQAIYPNVKIQIEGQP